MTERPRDQPMAAQGRLRRLTRQSQALESLDFFSRFDKPTQARSIDDARRVGSVIEVLREGLRDVLIKSSTVRGWHVQAMFIEMVAALGDVAFIKEEDQGTAYYEGTQIKVPDYRIVTRNGDRLLIETKNCWHRAASTRFSMSVGELGGLKRYAELDGTAKLKLAIYWANWNMWTLIDPDRLNVFGARAKLELNEAFQMNEMASLGDVMVATRAPLSLTFHSDPDAVSVANRRRGYPMKIARVEMACAGKRLETKLEKRLAYFFMLYGPWKTTDVAQLADNKIQTLTFESTPEHVAANDGVESLGFLSSLFCSYFNSSTLGEDLMVRALQAKVQPGEIGALIPGGYNSERLPIWRFVLAPNPSNSSRGGTA